MENQAKNHFFLALFRTYSGAIPTQSGSIVNLEMLATRVPTSQNKALKRACRVSVDLVSGHRQAQRGRLKCEKWEEQDSNLRRLSQQIYSLSRLTASVPSRNLIVSSCDVSLRETLQQITVRNKLSLIVLSNTQSSL